MNPLKGNSVPDELQTDDVMVQGDSYDEDDYYEEGTSVQNTEDLKYDEEGDDETRKRKQKNAKIYVLVALLVCVFIVVILICFMVMYNKKGGNLTGIFGGSKGEETEAPTTMTVTWRGETITVPVDEYGQPIYPEFKYTSEEIASLRQVGYTGDEIESFEQQMLEPQPLVTQAEMEQEAWAQQFVAPYFDTASEEWKSVINTTWYGLTKVEAYDTNALSYQNVSYTLNADYEKVEAYGHQLLVKVYLNAQGDYAFMVVTPERYAELPATGNMVVNITYTQTGDGQKFIISIVESRVD